MLRDKSNGLVQDRFAQLEKDSVDLVFIGTSHQFCSIDPDIIYNEYGVESYMLATSAQTVPRRTISSGISREKEGASTRRR